MGNTKTYYIEGELRSDITLEEFKTKAAESFRFTYCVAQIVEATGGYLGTGEAEGPFLVAAIHSSSMGGDYGPKMIAPLFKNFRMHRLDSDWSDVWLVFFEDGEFEEWRSAKFIKGQSLGRNTR